MRFSCDYLLRITWSPTCEQRKNEKITEHNSRIVSYFAVPYRSISRACVRMYVCVYWSVHVYICVHPNSIVAIRMFCANPEKRVIE